MNFSFLVGDKVKLRPIGEIDLEYIRELRNSMREHFFNSSEITREQQRAWYGRYLASYGSEYVWLMCLMDGTKVGTISLYNINFHDRTAFVGRILLDVNHRGKGYLTDAIKTVTNIAFKQMNLWKLKLSVFHDNERAISRYESCGFTKLKKPIVMMEKENKDVNWLKPAEGDTYDSPV